MIEVRDLHKVYLMGEEQVAALDGINLLIARGEYAAVTGPSGSGKSTLMNILGGLDRPSSGQYLFEGDNVGAFDEDDLAVFRNQRVGFIFQSFQLLPRLTALQNVELPMIYGGLPPTDRRARAADLLARIGLGDRLTHRPTQLSGGQQQRVAIARALANQPDIIFADEPTGALDQATGREVLELFETLHEEGLTLVMVTHDHDVASRARRRITFRDGKVVADEGVSIQ